MSRGTRVALIISIFFLASIARVVLADEPHDENSDGVESLTLEGADYAIDPKAAGVKAAFNNRVAKVDQKTTVESLKAGLLKLSKSLVRWAPDEPEFYQPVRDIIASILGRLSPSASRRAVFWAAMKQVEKEDSRLSREQFSKIRQIFKAYQDENPDTDNALESLTKEKGSATDFTANRGALPWISMGGLGSRTPPPQKRDNSNRLSPDNGLFR